jgi:excisionase family DNA binding protein
VNGRLLTLAETAIALGCSLDTVKRRVRSGAIPVFRDGRIVRVRESDLQSYVALHVTAPRRVAVVRRPLVATDRRRLPVGRLWDS